MTSELQCAVDAMIKAFKATDEYKRYAALREQVMANDVNRQLLSRYTHAQNALQMAALSGTAAKDEDLNTFEKLSLLLYQSEEMVDYLLAEMRTKQLAAEAMEQLSREAGMDVELPAM